MVYNINNILFHFHIAYGGREGDLATFYSRSFTGLFLQASIGLSPNKSYGTYYEFYVVIIYRCTEANHALHLCTMFDLCVYVCACVVWVCVCVCVCVCVYVHACASFIF